CETETFITVTAADSCPANSKRSTLTRDRHHEENSESCATGGENNSRSGRCRPPASGRARQSTTTRYPGCLVPEPARRDPVRCGCRHEPEAKYGRDTPFSQARVEKREEP